MIRVLRVIEYTYEDGETMARDMEKWGVQSTYFPTSKIKIKSAVVSTEEVNGC